MRTRRIEQLWIHLTAIYGSRWGLEYGSATSPQGGLEPMAEIWAKAIDDLPNDALAVGLRKLLARDNPHPPSLPEFLRLCGARFNNTPAPSPSTLPRLPAAAYADSPSLRCQRLANLLQQQAKTDLQPRAEKLLPHDRPKAQSAYWQALMGAVRAGKADDTLPDGWRTAAGMPKPEPRARKPGDIPTVGEQLPWEVAA